MCVYCVRMGVCAVLPVEGYTYTHGVCTILLAYEGVYMSATEASVYLLSVDMYA